MRIPVVVRAVIVGSLTAALLACGGSLGKKEDYLASGNKYASDGKYKEAIVQYRNALKVDPRYGEARLKFAEALEQVGRTDDSLREYMRAAELMPNSAPAQVKAGYIRLAAGQFEEAQHAANLALKADPKNVDAQILLANALAGLKDLPSALTEAEEAIALAPENDRAYTNMGALRMMGGQRKEAEAAFLKASELAPASVDPHLALANFYWSGGDVAKAEAQLEKAVAIDPNHTLANQFQAVFYQATQRPDKAEAPLLRLAKGNDADAGLMVADYYVSQNRIDEARPIYDRLLKEKRLRTAVVARIARLEYAAGHHDKAYAALDEELKQFSNDVGLLTQKSDFLRRDGKYDEAEQVAAKAVAGSPNSATAQFALGMAQAARGDGDGAIRSFNETLRINPQAAAADLQLSRLMLARGKVDEALRHSEAARTAQPSSLEAQLTVVSALLSKRDLARAESELKTLQKQHPEVSGVHSLNGILLAFKGDRAGAIRELDRALELDPANLQALSSRIGADVAAKRPADARARIARALAKQPANAPVLVLAGRFEASQSQMPEAEQYFRQAIEADPANLEAYAVLGQLYLTQRNLEQSRQEFERLAERSPNPVGARTMVGIILDLQGRKDEARKVYEDIVNRNEKAPVAANNLAFAYAEKGENLDVALQLAQRAKQQLPDQSEVDDTLGWVFYKRNMTAMAVQTLERSVSKDPKRPDYHYHLGLAYQQAGRTEEARKAFQQALDLQPNFEGAADARARLAALKG